MEDAAEGVELTHPSHGRGYISDYRPRFDAEPDEVTVHFYDADDEHCRSTPLNSRQKSR